MTDIGLRPITLSSSILSVSETSEMITEAIIRTFREGGRLLDHWREVTRSMFPGRRDLVELIPEAAKLSLSKLAKGAALMTDTCNPARKFCKLLIRAIVDIAKEEGMTDKSIKVYEADCWHHLRNVWIGAVVRHLGVHVGKVLDDNLAKIHHSLRVKMDIGHVLHAVEKYFGVTANYTKAS